MTMVARPPSPRLPIGWLTIGLLAGVVYSAIDTAMDTSLLHGGSLLAFDAFHRFFNTVTPPVAGMAVGVLFAYMRQRDARVAAEKRVSETLRERLQGAERQQAVWLVASSLLHDVRNPLHALGLLLEEVGDRRDELPPDVAERLGKAQAQAERIEQKIASLRELAESPPVDRKRVRIGELVQSLVADLAPTAAASGVELRLAPLPSDAIEFEADERYVRTPLENLIANAIQATSATRGHVEVRVEGTPTEVRVEVIDDGPGVPASVLETLFEPLNTARNLGLGLGLPLARALARLENAEVRLLSNGPPRTVFALIKQVGMERSPG